MARFASVAQLDAFASLAPVQSMLQGDAAVPVRVVAHVVVDVAPVQQSTPSRVV